MTTYPQRIVCLTAETTEIAFRLGAADRIVGVSGYAMRPPEARLKPKVAAFTTVKFGKMLELKPDLVLSFSDLQKDIVRDLVEAGVNVLSVNQRSLAETYQAILLIGAVLGLEANARSLIEEMEVVVEAIRRASAAFPRRPRVFFEEWDDPLISGIRWVAEIIEIAGGEDVFPEMRECNNAPQRIVDPAEVVRRNPEVIIASWCGKKVVKSRIRQRPGWDAIEAVRHDRIYEVKSPDILAPGPSLLYGLRQIHEILQEQAYGPA